MFYYFILFKKRFYGIKKELRKKCGLSQERFAELVNIEQNTLSYIETGNNFCSAETLEKLIKALEIEPEELFDFGHYKDN